MTENLKDGCIGQKVKIELKSRFILFCTILDKTSQGVWVKTDTETSFISFDLINSIRQDKVL